MAKTSKEVQQKVGSILRQRREELRYSQQDVSDMTGLSVNTISAIERGANFTAHNFYLLCSAMEMHPRTVYNFEIRLEPPFRLPPRSQSRIGITRRLENLVEHSDFFEKPKRVSDVLRELGVEATASKNFSVYLAGYCKTGKLEVLREGKINRYKKRGY